MGRFFRRGSSHDEQRHSTFQPAVEMLEPRQLMSVTQDTPDLSIFAPGTNAGNKFGVSVARLGDNILVGNYLDNVNGVSNTGSVLLIDPDTGDMLKKYTVPGIASGSQLGHSIAVSAGGNRIAIGAIYGGQNKGGAVFILDADSGDVLYQINNPSPTNGDQFGYSIATVGSNFVVGAPFEGDGGSYRGLAYVYDYSGGYKQTIAAPNQVSANYFAKSVAASGDNIVIGAEGYDTNGISAGAAFVYSPPLNGTRINSPTLSLRAPTLYSGGQFGSSVSANGNQILVGSYGDDTTGANHGAAFLYDTSGNLEQSLFHPQASSLGQFGWTVELTEGKALVGAHTAKVGSIGGAGRAYMFDTTTGEATHYFINPTPGTDDRFGRSLMFLDDRVVITAYQDNTQASDAGAAYIFTPYYEQPLIEEVVEETEELFSDIVIELVESL